MTRSPTRWRRAWRIILALVLCCAADAFVLRTAWLGTQIVDGQFRRAYFEHLDGHIGLTMDGATEPIMIPWFLVTNDGDLSVPPGFIAVAPLDEGLSYSLEGNSALAPYAVVGTEATVSPAGPGFALSPGEASLGGARTPALRDGRLTLIEWHPEQPWQGDAERLAALRDGCSEAERGEAPRLTVAVVGAQLHASLGRCSYDETLAANARLQLAALAGPDWLTVARRPGWITKTSVERLLLALIVVKTVALWWSLGLASAVATAATLGAGALVLPVPAMMTWVLALLFAVAAAIVRAIVVVANRVPRRWRLAAAIAMSVTVCSAVIGGYVSVNDQLRALPIVREQANSGHPDTCAIIGYSTVKGEGLRHEHGGIRDLLNENCGSCREKTAGMFTPGATLAWIGDSYCSSDPSFGSAGHVAFLGGANDDILWGALAFTRLTIAGHQGRDEWQRSQAAAVAASRGGLDSQVAAIDGLMRCVAARRAEFLYLHDFLVTDLIGGRGRDRASMLERRRAAVEERRGTFVDLLDTFADEVGIAWFDDFVHLSRIGHERAATVACRVFASVDEAPDH